MERLVSNLKMLCGIYEQPPKISALKVRTGVKNTYLFFYFEINENGEYNLSNPNWRRYSICTQEGSIVYCTSRNLANTLKVLENRVK